MASERMEDGIAKQNKTADEIASTAKRAALRLQNDYGMALDDIYIDVSVSAVVADTNGLHRATLEAVRTLHTDPQLKGMHIMGGLTNIGQQLPPKAADGSDLKLSLECAFLTLAVPLGFDTILCTPWRELSSVAGRQLRPQGLQEYSRADRQQRVARGAQALPGITISAMQAGVGAHEGAGLARDRALGIEILRRRGAGQPEIIRGRIDDQPRRREVRHDHRKILCGRKPGQPVQIGADASG